MAEKERELELSIEELKNIVREALSQQKEQTEKVELPPEAKDITDKNAYWKNIISKALSIGGLSLPAELYKDILMLMHKWGILRSRAQRIKVSPVGVKVPVGQEGVAYEVSESGTINELNPNITLANFTLRKLAAIVALTNEMLEAWDISAFIENYLSRALAKKEDMIGFAEICTSSNTTAVTVASQNAISYDNLVSVYNAIDPAVKERAEWFITPSTMAVIQKLKDSQNRPLVELRTGDQTIFGRRVIEIPDILPTDYYLVFGTAESLVLAEAGGLRIEVFDSGSVGSLNLLAQDMKAIRGVELVNFLNAFSGVFAVVKKA